VRWKECGVQKAVRVDGTSSLSEWNGWRAAGAAECCNSARPLGQVKGEGLLCCLPGWQKHRSRASEEHNRRPAFLLSRDGCQQLLAAERRAVAGAKRAHRAPQSGQLRGRSAPA